ncbi:MAG TPA: 50S ribosomal protein L21 [Patescibacteria group bacterium]|nr:50S ribosomal protein L21 [Patescibacteria group bacterium]
MKYAVIRTGGKQYRVAEGDTITVERLPLEEKAEFVCEDVLLINNDGSVKVGTPAVAKAKVTGTVVSHVKGEKIRVGKYKAKVRIRKVTGHRQSLSQVQITKIV